MLPACVSPLGLGAPGERERGPSCPLLDRSLCSGGFGLCSRTAVSSWQPQPMGPPDWTALFHREGNSWGALGVTQGGLEHRPAWQLAPWCLVSLSFKHQKPWCMHPIQRHCPPTQRSPGMAAGDIGGSAGTHLALHPVQSNEHALQSPGCRAQDTADKLCQLQKSGSFTDSAGLGPPG